MKDHPDKSSNGSRKQSNASDQKPEKINKDKKNISVVSKKVKKFNLNQTEIGQKIEDLRHRAKGLEGPENKKRRLNFYRKIVQLKRAVEDPDSFIIDKSKEQKAIADRRKRIQKKIDKKRAKVEEARLAKIAEWKKQKNAARLGDRRKQCLLCKKYGHSLNECNQRDADDINTSICYNCGKKDHTLKDCPRPVYNEARLKFATCFICKKLGHLSKDCPENDKGIYPYGGSCYFCGSKMHRKTDCPKMKKENYDNKFKNPQHDFSNKANNQAQEEEVYDDPNENINEELEDDF